MKVTERPGPPTGIRRAFFRAPIHHYRWHLGFLLGGRFLLLEHIGRKSGKIRQVVLEVVNSGATSDGYVVGVGFGPKADWYRNLLVQNDVTIQVGSDRLLVTAEFLSPDEGSEFMARYGAEHPKVGVRLCKMMGFEVDGSADDFRQAGRQIRFVRFRNRN
ncbi:nitroreductase family deazaflavin-dependent oxidoreductase [Rhodococcus marinonascens]|uniref:nitroreductase family deazaflavin-dependent oxidoreductase n=1 Tax=Rhodococcus marinonascens TaxID=38311 RepID=UPI000934D5B4|nr:nitroreductase family deazaflavin-dependent oxidoreductase [Rhodococcus marinonascens]